MSEAEDATDDPTLVMWKRGLRVILATALDVENDTDLAESVRAEEIAACTPRDTGDPEEAVQTGVAVLLQAVAAVSLQLVSGLRELSDELHPEQAPASVELVLAAVWEQLKANRQWVQIDRSLDAVLDEAERDVPEPGDG